MTENLKELIDKIKVLQEEEGDMKKIEEKVFFNSKWDFKK